MKQIWDTVELASQPKFYQNSGQFPSSASDIHPTVFHYLADQIEADVDLLLMQLQINFPT